MSVSPTVRNRLLAVAAVVLLGIVTCFVIDFVRAWRHPHRCVGASLLIALAALLVLPRSDVRETARRYLLTPIDDSGRTSRLPDSRRASYKCP
ncbi:MAG: hypothetical protein OXQ89_02960 [Rhodospirillaceae bacterium]|nr:hypothetical protein [Rhodospirillaceae bacterium]